MWRWCRVIGGSWVRGCRGCGRCGGRLEGCVWSGVVGFGEGVGCLVVGEVRRVLWGGMCENFRWRREEVLMCWDI